jgi:protocatechuate 3,4-dioxygenase beta subunit
MNEREKSETLSRYIDGELPPTEREVVAARIESDPVWRENYVMLSELHNGVANAIPITRFGRPKLQPHKPARKLWAGLAAAALILVVSGISWAAVELWTAARIAEPEIAATPQAAAPASAEREAPVTPPREPTTPDAVAPARAEENASASQIPPRSSPLLSGTVTNMDGAPLMGATVRSLGFEAGNTTWEPFTISEVETDENGMYSLPVSPAMGAVLVLADGYRPVMLGTNRLGEDLAGGELDVRLRPALQMSGRVVDETGAPIAGVSVTHRVNDMRGTDTRTDAEGNFTIPVHDESPALEFLHTDYAPVEQTGLDAYQRNEFVLKKGGALNVYVMRGGQPVADAFVQLSHVKLGDWRRIADPTDENGLAEFPNLLPTEALGVQVDIGTEKATHTVEPVEIRHGEIAECVVELPTQYDAALRGVVREDGGIPVQNAIVRAHHRMTGITRETRSDSEGRYELELQSGPVSVEAQGQVGVYRPRHTEELVLARGDAQLQRDTFHRRTAKVRMAFGKREWRRRRDGGTSLLRTCRTDAAVR